MKTAPITSHPLHGNSLYCLLFLTLLWATSISAQQDVSENSRRVFTPEGEPVDPSFFPIAVWLQNPRNAERFQSAGINLYIGLWHGPTQEQLSALQKAHMPVICAQNDVSLTHRDDSIIAAWMHSDEPDNAQARKGSKGYDPPIPPAEIASLYQKFRSADPTRPVILNLGQGVANDQYRGRGTRSGHLEDYTEYLKGCDIASFDIYPVVHRSPEIVGKLEFVSRGVSRLREWSHSQKPIWHCVECTDYPGVGRKANPDQIRSEVWLGIISGSRGIIYFVHQFQPRFREAALLDDPETLAAVTRINSEIRDLAPVLNQPTIQGEAIATAPLLLLHKRFQEDNYLFAVNSSAEPIECQISLLQNRSENAEIIGESRTISLVNGNLKDHFGPYSVHLYRLR